ncbi:nicotianamine synthase family protein [Fuchsiella alkaliacetigena]|uniref:nicotianamine synthase family protein n=1 Tax=Fuchsiella alkaliacetigena TaxID=957042 RepID=UPI00200ABC81|nr:nicotianamine synthase family protein [Fuchsiella alkaliacetigena]MCK8825269.1 hypothetical protein [Fuchsiella alkaliacetigena]
MDLIRPVIAKLEKVCNNSPLLFNLYSWPYKRIVQNEIDLAEIGATDRVLNIGCGAMPFTAVHVARLTGAKVWALDKDPEVIARARNCLARLGLEKQVKVFEGDGKEPFDKDFTAALVALQAEPKEKILKNLLARAQRGANLVFREPRGFFAEQYDQLPSTYQPCDLVKQPMITFDRSVLFKK